MDELKSEAFIKVYVKGDVTEVRLSVSKSLVCRLGSVLIKSYLERLYDVVSFRVSFDPRNFDRKISFCVKGSSFDVSRFVHFFLSL